MAAGRPLVQLVQFSFRIDACLLPKRRRMVNAWDDWDASLQPATPTIVLRPPPVPSFSASGSIGEGRPAVSSYIGDNSGYGSGGPGGGACSCAGLQHQEAAEAGGMLQSTGTI